MKRKSGFLKLLMTFLILLIIIHSFVHLSVYGTGISAEVDGTISGFSVGKVKVGEEIKSVYPLKQSLSGIFVVGEWVLLLIFFVFFFTKSRLSKRKEFEEIHMNRKKRMGTKTDIDVLYEMLKEKKRLRFSSIAKAFEIEESVVMEWGKTLESGGLALIDYPRFGEPYIVIKEETEVKNEEKEKANKEIA
ncbi:hypothetical protein HY450_02300 [Candidatus Pacearchaeota archaeon]|nr:hypothetical protein [Candidatus Pacearchaeota archaeon]